jgi:hypothetical protein
LLLLFFSWWKLFIALHYSLTRILIKRKLQH